MTMSSPSTPMEIKLGDLDLKAPDGGKAPYWRSVEESLIREGWYTGTDVPVAVATVTPAPAPAPLAPATATPATPALPNFTTSLPAPAPSQIREASW